ncbi:PspC domain-containing protein [Pseudolysinimonas sp.]|uniref:PspC domain-containing protein n=1 Tax=Pseudolysinimonas sp. TaxID=2680009 RepID=UPI003F80933E
MTAAPTRLERPARPALRRPRRMVLGGVCAGVAQHLERPVGAIRLAAIVLALLGGGGVLLYLWLWALVPLAEEEAPRVRRSIPGATILVSLSGVAAVIALGIAHLDTARTSALVPAAVDSAALAILALVWTLVLDRADPRHDARYRRAVGAVAGGILVAEGILLLPMPHSILATVLGLVVAFIGVVILIAPRIVGLWTDLMTERTARDRESQRAEIAAHLHDSVLQTLAIIQHRAGPQSEVARLARAQERELRDWLFAGTDPFAGDAATELRTTAGELELAHPVRFEIVTVGDTADIRSGALIGAAREAMLNAARHAGGDVAVYLEVGEDAVELFVRDRGAGFDVDAVAEGRIGVRESIVGRMERSGGQATVRSDDRGTEVRLRLPLPAARA